MSTFCNHCIFSMKTSFKRTWYSRLSENRTLGDQTDRPVSREVRFSKTKLVVEKYMLYIAHYIRNLEPHTLTVMFMIMQCSNVRLFT